MNYYHYTPEERKLAEEIASTLNDPDGLSFYLQCARDYDEDFLRRRLARVMRVPDEKITVSRGALFTHLVKQASHDARP
jgi:hypothetical protein